MELLGQRVQFPNELSPFDSYVSLHGIATFQYIPQVLQLSNPWQVVSIKLDRCYSHPISDLLREYNALSPSFYWVWVGAKPQLFQLHEL